MSRADHQSAHSMCSTSLEAIVADNDLVLPVRRLARNGFEAWAEVIARDYEGLVAKDETNLYEAGPTRHWLKVKQTGWTVEEDRWQRGSGRRATFDVASARLGRLPRPPRG
jgi:ATP-dependent DNA ligase